MGGTDSALAPQGMGGAGRSIGDDSRNTPTIRTVTKTRNSTADRPRSPFVFDKEPHSHVGQGPLLERDNKDDNGQLFPISLPLLLQGGFLPFLQRRVILQQARGEVVVVFVVQVIL